MVYLFDSHLLFQLYITIDMHDKIRLNQLLLLSMKENGLISNLMNDRSEVTFENTLLF